MKKCFKLLTVCLALFLILSSNKTYALEVSDVTADYWAAEAIVEAVNNDYIMLNGTNFNPNSPISRGEFANAVYKAVHADKVQPKSTFKDVSSQTKYSGSILELKQMQVLFGYPDGTFKPATNMKRSEASSVVANVLRSDSYDGSVLNQFKDKDDIPAWAEFSYINNIINDVYVNYPEMDELHPNEYMTRAEAAVLLSKLKTALNTHKLSYSKSSNSSDSFEEDNERYVPQFVGTNTLAEFQHSYNNTVNLYDTKKVILAGNIVPVQLTQNANSKKASVGDTLTYVSPKDVYSVEGEKLYSQGTKFIAQVEDVSKSYWFKKQDKAYIVFNKAVLASGEEFPVAGVLYTTYDGDVVSVDKKDSLKVTRDANKKYTQQNAAIRFKDKVAPNIKYKDNGKDAKFMLITGDMIIPEGGTL